MESINRMLKDSIIYTVTEEYTMEYINEMLEAVQSNIYDELNGIVKLDKDRRLQDYFFDIPEYHYYFTKENEKNNLPSEIAFYQTVYQFIKKIIYYPHKLYFIELLREYIDNQLDDGSIDYCCYYNRKEFVEDIKKHNSYDDDSFYVMDRVHHYLYFNAMEIYCKAYNKNLYEAHSSIGFMMDQVEDLFRYYTMKYDYNYIAEQDKVFSYIQQGNKELSETDFMVYFKALFSIATTLLNSKDKIEDVVNQIIGNFFE